MPVPSFVTGTMTVYNERGIVEQGIQIHATITGFEDPDNPPFGWAVDNTKRTETSDVNGIVTFSNLIKGVTYAFQRGTETREYFYTVPIEATSPYELPIVIGKP